MVRMTTRFRTTESTIKNVSKIIESTLEESFRGEIVFGPIIVEPRFDHEGDEYLHTYIVFDGDGKKLDPTWTFRLRRIILDETEKDEVFRVPSISFVGKDEWEEALDDDLEG